MQRGEAVGAALPGRPATQCARFGFQTESNLFQMNSNLPQNLTGKKGAFPCSKKIQIKCVWKGIEIRNNFPYKNFSRFKMEFELKFRELL
jgi:hypothetical protein